MLCICLACSSTRPASRSKKLIGKALASNDRSAAAHSNFGIVLAALARNEEALASYDSALALKLDFVEALHNRAPGYSASPRSATGTA
jgi:tetratricopeptide (TPR) repeat protein